MVYSPKGSGNYYDLDKTRVKLFPNFTRHHLISHTYIREYLPSRDLKRM